MYCVYNVVGFRHQHGETSVTSPSVPYTPPVDSLSDVVPVTDLSYSDVNLRSDAGALDVVDSNLAVSYIV